ACQEIHLISTCGSEFKEGHRLTGSLAKPTVSPSILSYGDEKTEKPRCHSFITKGKIKYMWDCGHALAGKSVMLPPIE
ncbi:MAG: ammonia monooxygenase, partial [Bacteroidota bacterium]|nr:ammonia monooxygenase [Bacteroidota bacterium]